MGLAHGFGFWMDGHLKLLFREAPKVIVRAWAPEEFYVAKLFTFEGKLSGGSEAVLAYSECGPKEHREYMAGLEKGKIVIGGLALRVIRHFLEAAGGATHVYVGVIMDIDREMPPGKEEICVERLEVRLSFGTPDYDAELEIRGLGEYSVLTTGTIPGLDRWRIYSYSEAVEYIGLAEEGVRRMPAWLERALRE